MYHFEVAGGTFSPAEPLPFRQEVNSELDFSQKGFSRPSLDLLKTIRQQAMAALNNADALRPLLVCIRLICRIFYSLNSFGLSDHIEEQLNEWMEEFLALLKLDTNVLDDPDPDKETPLDAVKVGTTALRLSFAEGDEKEPQGKEVKRGQE